MKKLLIIGTGGFAREVFWHAQNSKGYGKDFVIKGFLEGNVPLVPDQYGLLPLKVIENVINYQVEEDDVFVIAIANSVVKNKIADIIYSKNGIFINLIHNTSVVCPNAKLGEGIILCQYTSVSCNTSVGNHVLLNAYSSMGHDSCIGDYSSVMGHVSINGNVKVGTHTFWGCGAKALPSSKVGNYAKVGAGSVVLKKVKEGQTVFGVPAIDI